MCLQGTPEAPGINTRALRELFTLAEARKDTLAMSVQASILEIYNDTILDLLSESPRATADKLEIKELGCAAACSSVATLLVRAHCASLRVRSLDTDLAFSRCIVIGMQG